MSYRAVGAGPGAVTTYKIDAPFPWGKDTEIALPLDQMMADAWTALQPNLDQYESKLVSDMEAELSIYAPRLAKDLMDNVVMPDVKSEVEVVLATLDAMKKDMAKTAVIVGLTIVTGVGIGAWWLKKGR